MFFGTRAGAGCSRRKTPPGCPSSPRSVGSGSTTQIRCTAVWRALVAGCWPCRQWAAHYGTGGAVRQGRMSQAAGIGVGCKHGFCCIGRDGNGSIVHDAIVYMAPIPGKGSPSGHGSIGPGVGYRRTVVGKAIVMVNMMVLLGSRRNPCIHGT